MAEVGVKQPELVGDQKRAAADCLSKSCLPNTVVKSGKEKWPFKLLEYYFHKKQWKEDLTNEQMYYLSLLISPIATGKNIVRSRDGISLEQIGRTGDLDYSDK